MILGGIGIGIPFLSKSDSPFWPVKEGGLDGETFFG
jgi:hypothetical protein